MSGPSLTWTWPSPLTKMEADLKFTADPGTASPYFLATQFGLVHADNTHVLGSLQEDLNGYFGLQTQVKGSGGKGVVFAIWNATNAVSGPTSTCGAFDGEGVGRQCYMPFNWVANKTYHFRVEHTTGTSFRGYIADQSTTPPTETYLGEIQAPAGTAGIGGSSFQWLEYYTTAPASCSLYPYVRALWSRPTGNGGSVKPVMSGPAYGDAYCQNSAVTASGVNNYLEEGTPGTISTRLMVAKNGKFVHPVVTGGKCGGGGINADGSVVDDCALLTRVVLSSGKIALQADSGYYVSCPGGGGSTATASTRWARSAESFTETIVAGKASYQSSGGKYLTAVNGGGGALNCNATTVGVNEQFYMLDNKAPSATVSVSTKSVDQDGSKAIDGVIDGYPGDASREWATAGEGVGAWIRLAWSASTAIQQVTLYDRPNLVDNVTGGTLTFSNGSSVAVGALPSDGTGRTVTFSPRNVTWVKFTVTSVAAGSANIGLAEMQVR